jgi:hypothetical protein
MNTEWAFIIRTRHTCLQCTTLLLILRDTLEKSQSLEKSRQHIPVRTLKRFDLILVNCVIVLQIKILMRYAVPLQARNSQIPFPLGSLEFIIDLILPVAIWPEVDWPSNRNKKKGDKCGRCVALPTSPNSCADCLEIASTCITRSKIIFCTLFEGCDGGSFFERPSSAFCNQDGIHSSVYRAWH